MLESCISLVTTYPDARNPPQSRLLLQKVATPGAVDGARLTAGGAVGSSEEATLDTLTADQVIRLRIPSAVLFALSTCSSAINDSAQLADDNLNIAAVMQFAGFRYATRTL
jgi:hypothetical protein